jgi:hypothetical protein
MHGAMHASPSRFLKIMPYFFIISACEESSLQMKHAKKLLYAFLTMKATTLDTHGSNIFPQKEQNGQKIYSAFYFCPEKDL